MKKPAFPLVSATWLRDNLQDPKLVLLDATIKKATATNASNADVSYIPNTRFFDLKGDFSNPETTLPNMLPTPNAFEDACRKLGIQQDSHIVIYDRLGIYSSPRVWWMFNVMGFEHVAILDGGLPSWVEQGYPTEHSFTPLSKITEGDFKANYQPNFVVTKEQVLSVMHNKDVLILDARSAGRFKGTEPEPRTDLKGGHIPNSVSLPYTEVLNQGKMKSEAELQNIFSRFDLEKKQLIFTCGSGITACIILLAATIAGYTKLSVYDGSWSEWGLLGDMPIEC
ncbi:sulfurtransferase [Aquimarina brevivitae]|uniref:Thiosulfate/3-mercaptopyruvate sulfurtransferase n=1 Tax=Aquimarina brevivitae TaxID=323412 RepID=A0A4V2F7B5_9FLAO|nr:sulfurtransferase [Aquimarina brevivitae]RZS99239.1 thiosulfate/3-mercaptopyruvate sulfurtransferase [Aquimarina brevivitae]